MATNVDLDVAAVRARINGWRGDFEERLAGLVETPSVSMDPERRGDLDRCADLASGLLREAGAEVHLVRGKGPPLVMARIGDDPAAPTVTVYNHLDVQPADASEWKTPPFTFTRDGDRWMGRGTTDDKGPALTALFGARLARETGARINIQFCWELEEEIGSPNFAGTLESAIAGAPADGIPAFATDSVVVSDTIWIAAGRPAIPYGLRGLMGFTVALETGAKDVHSGTTGGAARNPIAELAALISECVDARTGRVKIPGFYSDVRRPTKAERAAFARAGFSARRFRAAHELHSLRPRADDVALLEAIMAEPTFEVHGIVGGYSGPGIKTIVPHRAEAKLSTRLVPDQRPDAVFRLIRSFIKQRLPDAVVTHEASLEPFLGDFDGPYNASGAAAMKETFGREPAFTREGGSIGAVLTMRRLLRTPIVFLGLSLPEHGYHAINENYDWGQAKGGMEMFCRYFHKLAQVPKPAATRAIKSTAPKPKSKSARAR